MEEKKKFFSNSKYSARIGKGLILLLLVVLEIVVLVQYVNVSAKPPVGMLVMTVACLCLLTVLCAVEMFCIKTQNGRIVVYVIDLLLLLAINAATGSTLLSALYCIILTQAYLNLEVFHTRVIIFIVSCVGFMSTCIVGWLIGHQWVIPSGEIINLVSSGFVGVILIAVHFVVENFLISFYNTNVKLKAALKIADERKADLENVYRELSETAVFQERNRIARDIHDNAGHSMTAVIMQTEAAKLLIDSNPEEAKSKIVSANIQAKNALEQMRESVHLLAGRNASRSLKQEAEEVLAQTMDGTGVNIRSDIADADLPWERRHFIINSLKECLANGIRHGNANAFYVEIALDGDEVVLTVSDNGCGLPNNFKEGFGIKGIREKATAFGGKMMLASEEGDGCEVKIAIKTGIEDKKEQKE